MKFFDFLASISESWKRQRVEKAVASVIHDTDFDERLRSLRKDIQGRVGAIEPALKLPIEELTMAIDELYTAFSDRRLSEPFVYCDCCITGAKAAHLQSTPLRLLDADDLYTVSANFPHTAGKPEDILYFAPRVLEHAARESCYLDVSQVFTSFQKERPHISDVEQAALDRFFHVIWTALRDQNPYHPLGIHGVVLPTAVLTGRIEAYLDLWLGSPAIYRYVARIDDRTLGDAFWDSGNQAHSAVVAWLSANRGKLASEIERVADVIFAENPKLLDNVKMRLANAPWESGPAGSP